VGKSRHRAERPARSEQAARDPASPASRPEAAIASARRIVRILNDFDQDPDVAAEFAAVAPNGRRDIPWTEFCRGRADADQLAQTLLDGTAAPIPHAVWGPVHTADAAGRNNDSYVVLYEARNPVHIDSKPVRLRVAVRSTQPDWIGATTRSGQVLGYGYWQLFPADPSKARRQGWIELQLWVKQPWQATRWDTDGTTIDLPEPRTMPAPERRTPPPAKAVPPAVSPALDKAFCASGPLPQPDVASAEAELELEPDAPAEHPADVPQIPTLPVSPAPPGPAPAPPTVPPAALPPLPPFPPSIPDADDRRTKLRRWLESVRRPRRP
jgi:hypothetical protein